MDIQMILETKIKINYLIYELFIIKGHYCFNVYMFVIK